MTSMGVPRLVLSKVLGHADGGGATHVYDQYSYEKEKRQALDAWGRKLETIFRGGKANVVTLIKQ
jgi:integrase